MMLKQPRSLGSSSFSTATAAKLLGIVKYAAQAVAVGFGLREEELHGGDARIDERAGLRLPAGHDRCLMMGQHEVREGISARARASQ